MSNPPATEGATMTTITITTTTTELREDTPQPGRRMRRPPRCASQRASTDHLADCRGAPVGRVHRDWPPTTPKSRREAQALAWAALTQYIDRNTGVEWPARAPLDPLHPSAAAGPTPSDREVTTGHLTDAQALDLLRVRANSRPAPVRRSPATRQQRTGGVQRSGLETRPPQVPALWRDRRPGRPSRDPVPLPATRAGDGGGRRRDAVPHVPPRRRSLLTGDGSVPILEVEVASITARPSSSRRAGCSPFPPFSSERVPPAWRKLPPRARPGSNRCSQRPGRWRRPPQRPGRARPPFRCGRSARSESPGFWPLLSVASSNRHLTSARRRPWPSYGCNHGHRRVCDLQSSVPAGDDG